MILENHVPIRCVPRLDIESTIKNIETFSVMMCVQAISDVQATSSIAIMTSLQRVKTAVFGSPYKLQDN